MPVVTCPKSRCQWKSDDLTEETAMRLVEMHLLAEHEVETDKKKSKPAGRKMEKVRRPEVSPEMTEERWAYFISRWESYKRSCELTDEDAVDQLLECLAEPVREDHYRQFAGVKEKDLVTVMEQVRQVAVRKANRAVIREKMGTTKQERGEGVRKFAGRIRALAIVSGFEVTCSCSKKVSYMEEAVKDKVIGGMVDTDVKTAVLGHKEVNTWSLEEMLIYIEAKEAGKVSVSLMGGQASAAAVSSSSSSRSSSTWKNKDKESKPGAKCDKCGRSHPEKPCPAREMKCFNCDKKGHLASKCHQPKKQQGAAKAVETKEEKSNKDDEAVEAVVMENDKHWICGVTECTSSDDFIDDNKAFKVLSDQTDFKQRRPLKKGRTLRKGRHSEGVNIGHLGNLLGLIMVGTTLLGSQGRPMLKHHVFNGKTWEQRRARPKPTVSLVTSVSLESYDELGVRRPRVLGDKVSTPFMTDTGASVSVARMQYARSLGIREDDLLAADIEVVSADGSPISVKGSVLVEVSGAGCTTREQVYICGGTKGCLLSLEACMALGIVPTTFPTPGSVTRNQDSSVGATLCGEGFRGLKPKGASLSGNSGSDGVRDRRTSCAEEEQEGHGTAQTLQGMNANPDPQKASRSGAEGATTGRRKNPGAEVDKKLKECGCGCPRRERPPGKPEGMPYLPVKENIEKLEEWLRDEFAASAFNVCECQPLPHMQGDPLVISVAEGAKPVASHSPIPVPVHWSDAVKKQLDRDVALGVIEKVPIGTDTTWCHRMVTVPKKDGTPRRTVNFQPLNEHAARQTHFTESPFRQAMTVPEGTFKTVLDAWNGYHSVALDPECRHLTTFITPWGRYRYRTMPQGYKAAGDAYTERFDKIIKDVKKKVKCVDDSLLWAWSIEEAFWDTWEYLNLCSENGIIFNPKKFVFCQLEVEYAGFMVGEHSVKPNNKMIKSIQEFPEPKNISDIRGWFGLVNQVSPFFAARPVMQPFRELLKTPASGKKIYWDSNLAKVFEESKKVIIENIAEGIQTFSRERVTCLATDWSKDGIGYLLLQKRCECSEVRPTCCTGGWGWC